MTTENSGEVIFDESKLRSHGKLVMETLGAAVECLDDSAELTKLLVEIGEKHAHYGVQPDMIPVRPLKVTVELQWLEHRWLVYHGYFELVLESLGKKSHSYRHYYIWNNLV